MWYDIVVLPTAEKDLDDLSPDVRRRILRKIERMQDNLAGDVKRLVSFRPEYRLRVGDWRVLFDIRGTKIFVEQVRHRSEAY